MITLRSWSSILNFPVSVKKKEIDKLYRCVLTIIITSFPLVTERCSGSHAHEHGDHEYEYEYNQ